VGETFNKEVTELEGRTISPDGQPAGVRALMVATRFVYLLDQAAHPYTASGAGLRTWRYAIGTLIRPWRPRAAGVGLFGTMLQVLSCGQYEACTKAVPNMFGLSAASVSRRFIRASAQVLRCSASGDWRGTA